MEAESASVFSLLNMANDSKEFAFLQEKRKKKTRKTCLLTSQCYNKESWGIPGAFFLAGKC